MISNVFIEMWWILFVCDLTDFQLVYAFLYIYIYWFVHLIKIWSSHMSPCHYFKSPSGNTTITLITRLAKRDPMSGSRHKQTSPWKNHGELWAMKFQMQNQTLSHPKWGDVYFITEKQQQQQQPILKHQPDLHFFTTILGLQTSKGCSPRRAVHNEPLMTYSR